jgi:hypothetical protein
MTSVAAKTAKSKAKNTVGILQAVNKPLTFFALVVLVIEGTLVVIGQQGNEATRLILAYGTVFALILSIIVVFTLVLLPQTRSYLLGEPTPVPTFAEDINKLRLSSNDYRLIRAISKDTNKPAATYANALVRSDKPLDQRIKALVEDGFIDLQYPGKFSSELTLSEKGSGLARVIATIEGALMEIPGS